jgi:hypothetical protein
LGAGAYHGSRRRLRHSISAVGTETPSTKRRPLGPLSPADKINAESNVNPDLLIGIAALIIAAGLFATALPNKYGESPRFLQSYAAPMVYPAAVLIFLALGVACRLLGSLTQYQRRDSSTSRPLHRRGPTGLHRTRFEKRKKKNPTEKVFFLSNKDCEYVLLHTSR